MTDAGVLASPALSVTAAAVEAVLLVTDVAVAETELAQAIGTDPGTVRSALGELSGTYARGGHGVDVVQVAGGWRLTTRPEHAEILDRHLREGQQIRLTQAALEALAVVAYQQPVTRGVVSSVRGVSSDGVLRTLAARELITEDGTDPAGAVRYRTTDRFLDRLGLRSLDELPPLAPHLPDLAEVRDLGDTPDGGVA